MTRDLLADLDQLSQLNIIEAIDSEHLLGHSIRNPVSWRSWRTALAAAFALPLDEEGAELFQQCAQR